MIRMHNLFTRVLECLFIFLIFNLKKWRKAIIGGSNEMFQIATWSVVFQSHMFPPRRHVEQYETNP